MEYEGFVTNISKKGVFVKKYLPEELDTLHRMLMRLEGLAVEMALPKLSRNDITDLQNITRRLGALASKRDYGEYLTLNTEFHLFFPRRSGSGELLETISQLRKRIFRFALILIAFPIMNAPSKPSLQATTLRQSCGLY